MNRMIPLAGLLFLSCLLTVVAADDLVWQINYAKSHLLADVRLNGLPIYRFSNTNDNSGALMIGPWLHEGRNLLSVSLAATPTGASGDEASASVGDPSFSFGLSTQNRSDPGAPPTQLFRIKLPMHHGETIALPWQMDFSIFLEKAPPSQLWTLAPVIEWNLDTKPEAQALMAQVFEALQNRNAEAYFALYRWAIIDTYTAHGWMSDDLETKLQSSLADMMKSPDFEYVAADPSQLIYETVPGSGNKLIAVRGLGGKPVIDAGAFSQEQLFLARIDGKLAIVRN